MAASADTVIEIVKQYIRELRLHDIPVQETIIFGSYVKGNATDDSDIDIAVISDAFSGDRFDDRRRIVPFRRNIDSRIEPIPFRPERFAEGGNLVDDIKKTGIIIAV